MSPRDLQRTFAVTQDLEEPYSGEHYASHYC